MIEYLRDLISKSKAGDPYGKFQVSFLPSWLEICVKNLYYVDLAPDLYMFVLILYPPFPNLESFFPTNCLGCLCQTINYGMGFYAIKIMQGICSSYVLEEYTAFVSLNESSDCRKL